MESTGLRPDMSTYWEGFFREQHAKRDDVGVARSLAYSNDKVQIQTYSSVLEGAGSLQGKTVWDADCGWGSMSLILHACGASVTGTDIVSESLAVLGQKYPFIAWQRVDLMEEAEVRQLPQFDTVVACEVLQHVDGNIVLPRLWERVKEGGRLVGCISNSECPIVASVVERLPGLYSPLSEHQIRELVGNLPDVQDIRVKGLVFASDQQFLPYEASEWNAVAKGTPNRLVFSVLRGSSLEISGTEQR